jgi:hypothetical protein
VADTFNFVRNDKRIVKYLTATEINGVTTWQNISLDYEFEFHTMHTIGNPVYMREKSLGLGSSLPKIDTKDKSTLTIKVVNPERIKNPKCLEDFTKVVKANLPLFQKLAKIYYEGEEIAATGPTTSLLVVFRCTTVSTVKPMYVKVPKAKEFHCGNVVGQRAAACGETHMHAPQKCGLHGQGNDGGGSRERRDRCQVDFQR